ncbi:hypothetical protein FQN60_011332 [Etheostoma spectabile]|uniref:Uncharacterized protein n=1 Tax=Etheostoma spectabile TaxID=54343 RepID=A0A5J5DRW6_9PERO|nr:hypothetical protein FQN60_011332 [Etheostoma spectabile]
MQNAKRRRVSACLIIIQEASSPHAFSAELVEIVEHCVKMHCCKRAVAMVFTMLNSSVSKYKLGRRWTTMYCKIWPTITHRKDGYSHSIKAKSNLTYTFAFQKSSQLSLCTCANKSCQCSSKMTFKSKKKHKKITTGQRKPLGLMGDNQC